MSAASSSFSVRAISPGVQVTSGQTLQLGFDVPRGTTVADFIRLHLAPGIDALPWASWMRAPKHRTLAGVQFRPEWIPVMVDMYAGTKFDMAAAAVTLMPCTTVYFVIIITTDIDSLPLADNFDDMSHSEQSEDDASDTDDN